MNSQELESKIIEVGANKAPRITPDSIKAKIAKVDYLQPEGTNLTICLLKLVNGIIVTGESACVNPENYNQEIGESLAYKKAFDKIWVLEGYLLAEYQYILKGKKE